MVVVRRVVSLAVAVGVVATACSGGGGTTDAIAEPPVKVTRQFGYIRTVEIAERQLEFDRAQFLTGARANAAARADGAIAPNDTVPNDYYIRNRKRTYSVLPLAARVRVTTAPCDPTCREGVRGELRAFAESFAAHETTTLADLYRGSHSQYWLTLHGGRVVAIDEQYLP